MNSDVKRPNPVSPSSAAIDIDGLAQEIDARIRALPDPRTDPVRAVRREFSRRLSEEAPEAIIGLALVLIREYWRRSVAYELVHHHRPSLQSLGSRELEELGRGINSWWTVDGFATLLAGPAWREGQVSDQVIDGWAHSSNRWWRRTALVSTVALNIKARGGAGDVRRTLRVCSLLASDHDDMVVKAMSWALRVLIQHDPEAVRAFLEQHKEVLAAKVNREVRNRLATGLKNPRRTT